MSTLTQAERDKLPESAFGDVTNRKFPVTDQESLDAAAHLVGRAENPDAVRKRIIKIAKRLGLKLPDAWKEEEDDKGQTPPGLERKIIDAEFKELGDGTSGTGTYAVYAADFRSIDRAGERIEQGAFENLDEFVRDGFMALNHRWDQLPLATISSAKQDDRGFLVTGDFHGTPEAQAARTVMKERMARGKGVKMSVGYLVTKDAPMKSSDGVPYRLLKGMKIFECSLVNMPANPNAVAIDVKGAPVSTKSDGMSEGSDPDGGATVPADGARPKKGDHVQWKAYTKGMIAGCGVIRSIHTKGEVGGHAATEADPIARVARCKAMDEDSVDDPERGEKAVKPDMPCKCMATKNFTHHPVKKLFGKPGTPKPLPKDEEDEDEDTEDGEKPEPKEKSLATLTLPITVDTKQLDAAILKAKELAGLATKGQYLGNTDEVMASAAFERIHSILGYYISSCIWTDKTPEEVATACGAAIDEYREIVLKILSALLLEDDPEDNKPGAMNGVPLGGYGGYGYRALAAISTKDISKYLAALASSDTSKDGMASVLSLETRSQEVVATIGEIRDVVRDHMEIRVKAGRVLSGSTRSRLQAVLDGIKPLVTDIESLLAETEAKPARDDPDHPEFAKEAALALAKTMDLKRRRFQLRAALALAESV